MTPQELSRLIGTQAPNVIKRAAHVWPFASVIFASDEAVANWLMAQAPAFDGEPPLTRLQTDEGVSEVISLLRGLAYGNFQ